MERSLKRAGAEHKERQLAVRLHPDVALYLVEQEPNFLRQLEKQTGLELEVRDDPMMRLDEFRRMAKPAGGEGREEDAGGRNPTPLHPHHTPAPARRPHDPLPVF